MLAWCGFLFFYGLPGPLYRTEALRAIIGQSALDGHWLAPTLYGEPFLTKPPGAYAAIAVASAPFGRVTEVSARIPSAIAATLTVLLAYGILRRVWNDRIGFAAAVCLPMSFLWLDKVPSAEIDILQLAWVSAALFTFWQARQATLDNRHAFGWWLASLMAVAGGFLTKWTAPAFFYLAVVPFLAWDRRLRWLIGRDHLAAALVGAGVCIVWAMLAAREVGWDALRDTVGAEAAQRFAPKTRGKPYPWVESLTFPAVFLGAMLPWSIPALLALRPSFLWKLDDRERAFVMLLHAWAWPNILFWSLPAQHNVRYVLPVAPAVTLLGFWFLVRRADPPSGSEDRQSTEPPGAWWVRATASLRSLGRLTHPKHALVAACLLWGMVKVVYVEAVVPPRTAQRNARETGDRISRLVPEGEILYLCRLKDEGILFCYGRPARRFALEDAGVRYAILLDAEFKSLPPERFEYLEALRDQQGDPIHLVRFRSWPTPLSPSPP